MLGLFAFVVFLQMMEMLAALESDPALMEEMYAELMKDPAFVEVRLLSLSSFCEKTIT